MFVVVLIELATALDAEATALAAALGGTAYEHRLRLLGGLPACVLTTADAALANRTVTEIRSRGHAAVLLDAARVTPSERMTAIRHFRLEPGAIVLEQPLPARLASSEISVLLRAVHRTRVDTRAEVSKKSFSIGRAVMTGGLMTSKTTKHEQQSSTTESQPVLYVFRSDGEPPWILRERGTNYASLGSRLNPSSMQNFLTTVQLIRELAPHAAYDERLLSLRVPSGAPLKRIGRDEETVTTSTTHALDLAAHALAQWLQQSHQR